jgi:Tol biopolymer transport system component
MSLDAGQRISFYEIVGPLGAGAMGDVYRARDTRLGRDVAIKVLPEAFVEDEERIRRFEREARTLASLNHANVGAIYGIDQVEDVCFLALELVPGEDLCDCLADGPLPVADALDVARQVAEGLEAAHAAGVVHRDLKPANVRVTPEGTVKVLDFGLAKPSAPHGERDLVTTEAGRLLGTPTYMSPEQARGRPVDGRTDVWAFGCILFELLTGRRAFEGETLADVLVAVAERKPDWSALPRATPVRVRRLLERCLTKDPRARLQHVGEARIVLEDPGPVEAMGNDPTPSRWLVPALVALALGAVGYVLGTRGAPEVDAAPTLRLGIQLPEDQELDLPNPRSAGLDGIAPPLAVSPDGLSVVYLAREADLVPRLYLRAFDDYATRRIEGTEQAEAPFFSPDGEWVGFFRDGGIYKVNLRGGAAPLLVCEFPIIDRPSASWTPEGTILFSRGINAEGRLERVPADGGTPEVLSQPDFAAGESWHGLPRLLPGGRSVLFTLETRTGTRAAILDLESGEQRTVDGSGEAAGARYLPGAEEGAGVMLFAQEGRLLAAGFDLAGARLTEAPWTVAEQVSGSALGIGHWDTSDNGSIVYVTGNFTESELVIVDRTGEPVWRAKDVGAYQHPRLSDDGRELLFDRISSGARDIWVYDLEREVPRSLTSSFQNMDPLWAPDGERVVFSRFVDNIRTLHVLDSTRVDAEPTRLLQGESFNQIAGTWTADGGLLFTVFGGGKEDLWLLPSLEDREARPLLAGQDRQGFGALSPDGRHLAYVTDVTGSLEITVCTFPELADAQQVTRDGGDEPLWSADGTELFFRRGNEFLAVPITRSEGGDLRFGEPVPLFAGAYDRSPSGHQHYDVSRDGQRFALVRLLEGGTESELRVILDWKGREDGQSGG